VSVQFTANARPATRRKETIRAPNAFAGTRHASRLGRLGDGLPRLDDGAVFSIRTERSEAARQYVA